MQHHNDRDQAVTLGHIDAAITRLTRRYVVETVPLVATVWTTPERVPFAQRLAGVQRPVVEGEVWGRDWETGWFHLRGQVPAHWAGAWVAAWLDIEGEGLLFSGDGRAIQGITNGSVFDLAATRSAVDLFPRAAGGEVVDLWLEGAANPIMGIEPTGEHWAGGNAQRQADAVRYGSHVASVRRLRLARVDRAAWDLRWDMEVARDVLQSLAETSVRRARLMRALDAVASLLGRAPEDLAGAREILAPELAKPAHASAIPVRAVGHAHIDTAWLWPLAETQRKTARTFANQLALIDKYPDYVFGASAPQHYQWIKDQHPEIYARIKVAVAEGRWELQGGMWVECDCNLPSGESMVRQLIHGKNFFRDEFGVEVDNLWIPDVFGYAASLPQIMAQAGITAFLTQKISWNQYNTFPYNTFWWQGIDGTKLLTHFPPENTYNGQLKPQTLVAAQERFPEKAFAPELMSLFGIGDGGGGPREDMLERAKRLTNLEGCPPVRLGRACDFFANVRSVGDQLQTWVGELYLELHRGTLTTQAAVKKANRRLEHRLRELELLWTLRLDEYPIKAFDAIWKEMLTLQFHDIIPGSSINVVYRETNAAHNKLLAACDDLQARFAATLPPAEGVTFVNSLSTPFHGVVVLPAAFHGRVAVLAGQAIPTQVEGDETVALLEIPAFSAIYLVPGAKSAPSLVPGAKGAVVLDNDVVRVSINAEGRVIEATALGVGRNLLRGLGNVFTLYGDHPLRYDAWDIDHFYRDERIAEATCTVQDLGAGPVRHRVRISGRIGDSTIDQVVSLAAGARRVDFATTVDWRETHKMLRVAFPAAVQTDRASGEIQYGHVFRPTHENTLWDKARFEVPAQRWVDVSEPTAGLALLNESKYGHRLIDNVLDLALLRAPVSPDPDADQGIHHFVYSLMPHTGDVVTSAVMEEAGQLNQPPMVFAGRAGLPGPFPATVSGEGVELAVIKRAERENCVVIRLVETRGRRCLAKVHLPVAGTLVPCDLLEWHPGEATARSTCHELEFTPFQIKTFMLRA
jgi:alpha-mannosidase